MKEGLSKMRGEKAPRKAQCALEFFCKKEVGAWLRGSCDCSIVVLKLQVCQGTGVGHAFFRSAKERWTACSLSAIGKLKGRVLIDTIRSWTGGVLRRRSKV